MRRPVLSLALAAGFLLLLAAPVLVLETGSSGPSTIPDRYESKQGYLLLNEEFPGQTTEPVVIAVAGDFESPALQDAFGRLEQELASRPIFGEPAVETRGPNGRECDGSHCGRLDRRPRRCGTRTRARGHSSRVRGDERRGLRRRDTAEESTTTRPSTTGSDRPRVRARPQLHPADDRVSLHRRSRDGDPHEPAVGGRCVRAARLSFSRRATATSFLGLREADTVEACGCRSSSSPSCSASSMDYQVFLLSRIRERFSQTNDNEAAVISGGWARPRGSSPGRRSSSSRSSGASRWAT